MSRPTLTWTSYPQSTRPDSWTDSSSTTSFFGEGALSGKTMCIRTEEERFGRVVDWYAYQRQWLSHKDAVSAVMYRYRINYNTLKQKCIKAGVWDV